MTGFCYSQKGKCLFLRQERRQNSFSGPSLVSAILPAYLPSIHSSHLTRFCAAPDSQMFKFDSFTICTEGKKPLMTAKLFGFIYIIFLFTYFDPCLKIRICLIKTFTTFLCEKLEYLSMIKTIVSPGAIFWDRMAHAHLNDTCSLVCHNPHYSLLSPTVRRSTGFSFSTLLSLLFFFVVQRYFSLPMYL